jgi:signal transduction histidine kinase
MVWIDRKMGILSLCSHFVFRMCETQRLLSTFRYDDRSVNISDQTMGVALKEIDFVHLIGRRLGNGRWSVIAATLLLLALTAFADWSVGKEISLGVLYIAPMMLGAFVLSTAEIAVLAVLSAFLRSRFDSPQTQIELILRFAFASLSYFTCGLFVAALVRNRRVVAEHLEKIQREQELRREAEEQLRVLVASSPAAILTLDAKGRVLGSNSAAEHLFAIPAGQTLHGRQINAYMPVLSDALRIENMPEGFRTAAQSQGHRENGEIFLAHTWFSSYAAPDGTRLAAIVVDSSEEMRDQEEQNLRQLLKSNKIAASVVSHELRNLCGAISLLCTHLNERHSLASDEDFQGITSLVKGLEKIALLELQSRSDDSPDVEPVPLRQVLDNLRIVIESEWREIDGEVQWRLPPSMPSVIADPPGLLQAFLNLAKNSHRAVQKISRRELIVEVSIKLDRAIVAFEDSGPGIAAPDRLFQPFQPGADGAGLGLYISRAVVRSYGGDLRFEPVTDGSRFVVELQIIE